MKYYKIITAIVALNIPVLAQAQKVKIHTDQGDFSGIYDDATTPEVLTAFFPAAKAIGEITVIDGQ